MTSQSLESREALLGRLIHAIGEKLVPEQLAGGMLLVTPSGKEHRIGFTHPGMSCELRLRNWRPVYTAIRRGAVGFAESYMAGDLDSPDITAVLRFYLQNRDTLDRAGKPVFFKSLIDKLYHLLRANTRAGAKRNISAHYDLGNAFYELWLDRTMSYSSAIFRSEEESLEASQIAKYDAVLSALELKAPGRILEIGCGWGGFAEVAADRGHRVTGLTISKEQLDFARNRLGQRAELRFEDYRDSTGEYDGIASIEMIEAVGESNWPSYFRVLRDRLKPGAAAAVQAITIGERFYPGYRAATDFIQRYIFPGGMLPTKAILAEQAARAGLTFETVSCFGQDYARTLRLWRDRFEANWTAISALGFDETFRRRWRYYLCYCEAGFAEAAIDVGIYRFRRPQ